MRGSGGVGVNRIEGIDAGCGGKKAEHPNQLNTPQNVLISPSSSSSNSVAFCGIGESGEEEGGDVRCGLVCGCMGLCGKGRGLDGKGRRRRRRMKNHVLSLFFTFDIFGDKTEVGSIVETPLLLLLSSSSLPSITAAANLLSSLYRQHQHVHNPHHRVLLE